MVEGKPSGVALVSFLFVLVATSFSWFTYRAITNRLIQPCRPSCSFWCYERHSPFCIADPICVSPYIDRSSTVWSTGPASTAGACQVDRCRLLAVAHLHSGRRCRRERCDVLPPARE